MSRIVLAMMALLLLVSSFGQVGSPTCQMSDLAQAASLHRADPCPGSNQMTASNTIHVHTCNCGSLIEPVLPLVTAVPPLTFSFFMDVLWPQTAVLTPPAPPPRFI